MSHRSIEFLRIAYLRGPNLWTYRPVIEAWVDIGELEDHPSNTLPGFYERLSTWLPGLVEHRCGVGERGGFLLRLREGTWPAHIMEHVAIELQTLAGMPTGFGKARSTATRGVYKVVVRARQEDVGRAAIVAARDLVMAAIEDRPYDVAATVAHLRELVDRRCLGPSTACIVDAAADRKIPSIRLTQGNLVQLGYGRAQRRIWTAETDRTSAIAESIASDKELTRRLLAAAGVCVPEGRVARDPADAWEAAQEIGLPVVVKPSDANHGRGISIELRRREDIEAAFHVAAREGSEVLVERYIPGGEHRLLVVGNRVVAASRGDAAWVTGDGRSTVAQLVETQVNSDPRRGEDEAFPLDIVRLHEPANVLELARQGYTAEAVPPEGQKVRVQRNGNLAIDVTDRVHPEVAEMVALAARVVGLDIAGVDVVAEDIGRPLAEQGGAIVEVNAGPGLLMHLKPAEGEPRPVGQAIVDHLFPEGETGRIPVVGVTGAQGTTLTARLLAWLLHLGGRHVGLACGEGLFIDRRRVEAGDRATWAAGQRVLMNRMVDAAVIENGPEAIVRDGLAYDRCQVGIVTGVAGAASLAHYHIHDDEQLYTVLRTQVDVVLPEGVAVLNADDLLAAQMAPLCDGDVIFYARDGQREVIETHLAAGRRAVFLRGQRVLMVQGAKETPLIEWRCLPVIDGHEPEAVLGAVMAASAAAWGLGMEIDLIRAGIKTFATQSAPPAPAPLPALAHAAPTTETAETPALASAA
ncbi:MAG: cyanophycin synthetase [Caldimonas sp.]|uniref:cyanophycin synthetase n=1 Tax=Caldimonas sp. TaxID=2838790 RepID=UPI00391B0213